MQWPRQVASRDHSDHAAFDHAADNRESRRRSGHADRFADQGGETGERTHLLRDEAQEAGEPRGAVARGQCRLGARRRGPARARTLRRAHGVQRHEAVSEVSDRRLHRENRHGLRCRPQRVHVVRRDGLPADRADRRSGGDRQGHGHPARLGGGDLVRAHRGRQGARRGARGVAARTRRVRTDRGQAVAGDLAGLALCDAPPDRPARHSQDRQARHVGAVLQGLVPAGQHGGDRDRRLRSRRDRKGHPDAVR